MAGFFIKRLVGLALTLLAASFLVFLVTEFSPGNVARKTLGAFATQNQVDLLYEKLKLNDPLLLRYGRWLGVLTGVLHDPLQDPALKLDFTDPRGDRYFGNFGYSTLFKAPVNDILWNRLGNTAILAGIAFAIIVPLSLTLGVLAGMREGSLLDRAISIFSIVTTSIPEFASGVFLVVVFVVWLGWLPGTSPLTSGAGWSVASQMILPVARAGALRFRLCRAHGARLDGRSDEQALHPHRDIERLAAAPCRGAAWRAHAMIAPFTVILLQINFLISGVVVTETVFAYPGFGRMLLEASLFKDISLIEASTLVALTIAIVTQLISDVGYALLNPQIRLA